jgi:hypothetical protein
MSAETQTFDGWDVVLSYCSDYYMIGGYGAIIAVFIP